MEGSRESTDSESKGELMSLSEIEYLLNIQVAGNFGTNFIGAGQKILNLGPNQAEKKN